MVLVYNVEESHLITNHLSLKTYKYINMNSVSTLLLSCNKLNMETYSTGLQFLFVEHERMWFYYIDLFRVLNTTIKIEVIRTMSF